VLFAVLALIVGISWFHSLSVTLGTDEHRRTLRIYKGRAVLFAPDTSLHTDIPSKKRITDALAHSNNGSVHWTIFLGRLHPYLQGGSEIDRVRLTSWDGLLILYRALDDPDRFALAHVMLCGAPRSPSEIRKVDVSLTQYEGLRVLGPLDSPRYDPSQIPELQAAWRLRLFQPRVQVAWQSLYPFLLVLAIPPLYRVFVAIRKARRPRQGLCPECAYNLTSNTTGICPECGAPVTWKPVPVSNAPTGC
jgi:hypothetical protein